MIATQPKPKWSRSPSPTDGKTYHTFLKNCIGDEWESIDIADPQAANGWASPISTWQDWAKEVKAWRPLS